MPERDAALIEQRHEQRPHRTGQDHVRGDVDGVPGTNLLGERSASLVALEPPPVDEQRNGGVILAHERKAAGRIAEQWNLSRDEEIQILKSDRLFGPPVDVGILGSGAILPKPASEGFAIKNS